MAKDFDSYWEELVSKNPGLAQPEAKMSMTVESLKRALKAAYTRGDADGRSFKSGAEKLRATVRDASMSMDSIFGNVFGK